MEMTRKRDLTLNNEHVTQSEAWAHLEELAGKPLHNRQLDKEADEGKKRVFVDDKCYYNEAGGFWCGMIAKEKLSDGTEQVKVGAKGKHGVIQGKELTGNFQQNVGAIYVWKRKDGSLQVISGRHRFAKLMEDAGAKYCNCYVFEEDAEHDEKWARMLDYENNMRDDQADEVTAATYVRETGLPDEVLKERGLMRNDSRSKRGIFIGRHARQELWTRFVNGAVKPKDAQTICELTRSVKAEDRIDEIQGKCCMLLDTGKSWEYIGGMVQLMASKEAQMKQGLLDFGADFMEDLTRAAEWIEKCVHKVDAAIKMLRNGRKMSGEMREEALRLGVQTETDADSEEVLRDLQLLRKKFELIGSYPDLVAQAQMWDGKSDVDPVGYYLENARKERIEAQLEGEMTAEEYLEEQARKAAAEAVPNLFTMEMTQAEVRTLSRAYATGEFSFSIFNERRWANDVWPTRAMKKIEADWLERLDAYIAEYQAAKANPNMKRPMGQEIYVCPTPGVLSLVGVTSRDVVTTRHALDHDMFTKHGMTRKALRHLPSAIANPICIAESQSVPGALEILTTLTETVEDSKTKALVKKNVLVALHVGVTSSTDRKLIVSKIASAYGKNHIRTIINKHKILYWNDQKGKVMLNDYRLQLPQAVAHDLSTGNIWDFNDLVKYKQQNKFSFSMERNLAAVTPEMDARYIEAVKRGDMDAAQRMVNDVARMRGYMPDSDYQGSECFNGAAPCANAYFDTDEERHEAWENGDFEGTVSLADFVRRGMDPGELEWLITAPGAYQRADEYKRESIEAIRKAKASKRGKVTIYRAVRADIKEGSVRNGDWITFSRAYAEYHISLQDWEKGRIIKQVVSIDDVWWDGNDVNEWGYDDGKEYAYRNTANNRKLLDPVTYDKNGNVVPLSKRFDYSSGDVSFSVIGPKAKTWDKYADRAFKGRDDGKLRAEIDASGARLKTLTGAAAYDYRREVENVQDFWRKRYARWMELDALFDTVYYSDEEPTEEQRAEAAAAAEEYYMLTEEVKDMMEALIERGGAWPSYTQLEAADKQALRMGMVRSLVAGKVDEAVYEKLGALSAGEKIYSLEDVLDFPELYEAYPMLKLVPVQFELLGRYNGLVTNYAYGAEYSVIKLNKPLLENADAFRSTLLHEVQHVIQRIEGYAKGGNVEGVYKHMKEELEYNEAEMNRLLKELRWFSALDYAKDYLKSARRLLRFPNAWKYNGLRYRHWKAALGNEDMTRLLVDDIAEQYEELRKADEFETKRRGNWIKPVEYALPLVDFSDLAGVERGLAALEGLKPRRSAFRGVAPKKDKEYIKLMKYTNAAKRMLDKYAMEPYELYRRLAGEIEARNVQARRDWSMDERLARPFNETLEYPGEALVSFSVIGPKAKTWDKYADRAFKGRDDGMLRAEIDASGARLKWEDLRGRNVAAYRRIVDDWYKLPDEECKTITEYAELYYDWQDELAKLNSTSEEDAAYFDVYKAVAKLRSELNEKRGGVRKLLGEWFVERGGGAAVMISANDALVDAVAASLWGPYVDYNVEDELDLQPLRHGGMALQDVLAYDELYKAYPELAQLRVETVKMEDARGCVLSSDGQHIIQINKNLEGEWAQFFSTLMHEVQHVIQDIEGFAKGGNPQYARYAAGNYKRRYEIQNESARLRQNIAWLEGYDVARREFLNIGDAISMREDKEKLQDLRDKYNNLAYQYNKGAIAEPGFNGEDGRDSSFVIPSLSGVTKGAYAKAQKAWDMTQDRKAAFPGMLERLRARYDVLWAEFSELDKQQQRWGALSSHELYLRLAGEIEARNVQHRVRMTADERLAMPFNETLEYPGEALVTFSMEPNLMQNIRRAAYNKLDKKQHILLCSMPTVLRMLGEPEGDVYTLPSTISKLVYTHNLAHVEVYRAIQELDDPMFVYRETSKTFVFVLEMEATNNKGEKSNLMVAIEMERSSSGHYLMSAYPLDALKKVKDLQRQGLMVYSKYTPEELEYRINNEATPPTDNAPSPFKLELMRSAVKGGLNDMVMTRHDIVKFNQTNFSASMEKASLQALEVLRTRADEREGERLMNDWQKACEGWAQLHVGGDDSRLGNGAKMLGEIYALIGATKGVLPEKYTRMGHLNGLLRWAAVYANMQQTGDVPAAGVIAGPIYEKFVERMRYIDKKNEAYGLNEAEVKEAMALLAGERLDVAMLKVARECKQRLELFLKDRERERIDWVVERAYPKREKGKRSPRGKMDADTYRRMERAYRLMEMEANDVAGLMNRIKSALENMETAPADAVEVLRSLRGGDVPRVEEVEALEAELEDELFLAQTFGCWENMAFEQARRASGAMAELVLLGRSAWQSKLRAERRRAAFDRDEVSRHFGTKLEDVQAVRGDKTAKEKGRKRTSAKNLVMGSMSYSQLLVALEEKLGKRFTGRHMRMIAEAHEKIMLENQRRHRWMYNTLRDITGLESEGEIEEWMQKNNEVFDTGIDLELPMKSTCRLTPEEAKMWLSLTAAERQKKREELVAEAAKKGEKPDNIPGEDVMAELEEKLVNAELNAAMPKEFVLTTEWSYKSRLRCTREALLYAILTFEQDDYEHLLEANGLTQAKLQQMRKLVGKELLRWGYAMRKELSEHGKMVAELYEAYTGVPFGQRQNYFRGVFDVARSKDAGEAVDQVSGVTGGKYGILIARQYHNQQLN